MTQTYFDGQLLQRIKLGQNNEILSILQGENLCHLTNSVDKSTLLHYAAEYGNQSFAQHLIGLGANVDAQNVTGETPLMLAVKGNRGEMVKLLLKAHADIFIADMHGECVLGKAYRMSEIKITIRRALVDEVTPESLGKSQYVNSKAFHDDCPLYYFISLKNTKLTRVLLEKSSPVDAKDPSTRRTALHLAVAKLDVEHVKLLIEYHADVNARDYQGKRPLALITDYNNKVETLEIVKVLINAGAILIDHDDTETLMKSILSNGNRELIRTIMQCNIDLHIKNQYSRTPMDYLFENENPDIYEELRNFKMDLSTCSNIKTTMLHRAAAKGNASLVKFLLERGADVNAKDCYERTSLCMAVDPFLSIASMANDNSSRFNIIEMLFQRGADPQILTKQNYSRIRAFAEPISDLAIELIRPVFIHLALHEASGRQIEQFMLNEIEKRPEFKIIYYSNKLQLEEMKQIKIDESTNLFDFLIAEPVSMYVQNEIFISNLTSTMKDCRSDSYYYRRLQQRFLKLTRLAAINEVFIKFYNISVMNIAEKIVGYLQ